ncbi:MAG: DEAD/DEAH box helicase family protein [Candidatus Sabulitectum sp.]|nr:DEAD/DEAH box helicase family protein [Candidatus Sabulitectum sp.]
MELIEISNQMEEVVRLRKEITILKELLHRNGILIPETEDRLSENAVNTDTSISAGVMQPIEKICLFQSLFRGRTDIYALRWQSKTGKSGYSPVCGNEWKPGICRKPKVKCSRCDHRKLLPLTDDVIYKHLAGEHTVGIYPLNIDDTCWWLALDFDDSEWKKDASSFVESCTEFSVPAYTEISRSGSGAHVWIFFTSALPAGEARELGTVLISHTCSKVRQLSLASYDRMFPNQDTLPRGGFGNLIALPLQKSTRQKGYSVFVNSEYEPFPKQWEFLTGIQRISRSEILSVVERLGYSGNTLDVAFTEEEPSSPWKAHSNSGKKVAGKLPASVTVVSANQVFVEKKGIPAALMNRIVRIAAFCNPEFYKAQAMRLPVWNKPRVICCAENYLNYIGLPRGCLDSLIDLLDANEIRVDIDDKRNFGIPIDVEFKGNLRPDQKIAVTAMMKTEIGVLAAPTAFGKTVAAAAVIAGRKVSTIILVHRTALLDQWMSSLMTFLAIPEGKLGVYGGGKKKLSGYIDIAVIQSVIRAEHPAELLESYGQVIVDECHHLSAYSFESVLKMAGAKYVMGLTATPVRRDGQQPIVFMQCGPVRHRIVTKGVESLRQEVWTLSIPPPHVSADAPIQDVFHAVVNDTSRNRLIADDVIAAYNGGRKILVLTERTAHLELLQHLIAKEVEKLFVLHGRISKGKRKKILDALTSLDPATPHAILATGRLIGEGFDHPQLDTLVLAMPISWKGTLQQYAGRLHRTMDKKNNVRIYDYIDDENPKLARMWSRRYRGYTGMGYKVVSREIPVIGKLPLE